jgi:hypothetical protein
VTFRFVTASLGLALGLSLAASCFAQSDQERAAARSAAKEGVEAFDEKDYEAAIRYLQKAESVIHAPTHLLFIARSQAALGKLVEARENYQKVITENLASDAPQAFLQAQQEARSESAQLESRIAKLILEVKVEDGSTPEDLEVTINGASLPPTLLGTPTPVNPGKVTVTVRAKGMQDYSAEVEIGEGKRQSIDVVLALGSGVAKAPGPSDSPGSASTSVTEPADEPKGGGRKTAGWISVGAGAALVGTGAALGAMPIG